MKTGARANAPFGDALGVPLGVFDGDGAPTVDSFAALTVGVEAGQRITYHHHNQLTNTGEHVRDTVEDRLGGAVGFIHYKHHALSVASFDFVDGFGEFATLDGHRYNRVLGVLAAVAPISHDCFLAVHHVAPFEAGGFVEFVVADGFLVAALNNRPDTLADDALGGGG